MHAVVLEHSKSLVLALLGIEDLDCCRSSDHVTLDVVDHYWK